MREDLLVVALSDDASAALRRSEQPDFSPDRHLGASVPFAHPVTLDITRPTLTPATSPLSHLSVDNWGITGVFEPWPAVSEELAAKTLGDGFIKVSRGSTFAQSVGDRL